MRETDLNDWGAAEWMLKRVSSSTGELCSYLRASLCSGSRPQTSGLRMKVGVTSTCWTARRSRTSSSWRGAWVSCCFSADIHWWHHRVNSSTNLQLCFLQVRVRQAGHPQRPHWQHRTYWKQTSYLHVSITWLSCRQVSTGEQPERSRWICFRNSGFCAPSRAYWESTAPTEWGLARPTPTPTGKVRPSHLCGLADTPVHFLLLTVLMCFSGRSLPGVRGRVSEASVCGRPRQRWVLKPPPGQVFRKRSRLVSCFWLCFVKLVFFSLIYSSFLGFVIFCLILNIFGHFAFFKKDFLVYFHIFWFCLYFLSFSDVLFIYLVLKLISLHFFRVLFYFTLVYLFFLL